MRWLDNIERKYGNFAIPNLTVFLVGAHCVLFFLGAGGGSGFADSIPLQGYLVQQGQFWRLFTFILAPPNVSLIWFIFAELLFYVMGTALEAHWGNFRYNIFIGMSWIATVVAAMIFPQYTVTAIFMLSSVLIGFAILNPNYIINLYFVFPIPVKYIALLDAIGMTFMLFASFSAGDYGMMIIELAGLSNLFVFFSSNFRLTLQNNRRQKDFNRKVRAAQLEPMHTCAVCGRTDRDDRYLDFRYLRKGDEMVCLCEEHLDGVVDQAQSGE